MTDDTTLIATIAAAFVLALAFGFVAVCIRIPPLVDYLIAGIALGPFTPESLQTRTSRHSSPRSA